MQHLLLTAKPGVSREARRLGLSDVLRINELSRGFLERTLAEPFDGVTIVIASCSEPEERAARAPCRSAHGCLCVKRGGDDQAVPAALWVHGHLHSSSDYRIGRTRVICDPRGYFPDDLNPSFDPLLTIEL